MKLRISYLALFFAGIFAFSAKAELLNFDFSITGNDQIPVVPEVISLDGTITGEIVGLENSSSPSDTVQTVPTDILIPSLPDGLGITVPPGGYSLSANGWTMENSFAVSDGQISSQTYDFEAYSPGGDFLQINVGLNGQNGVVDNSLGGTDGIERIALINDDGFSGITFTPVAAPEPGGLLLLLLGGVALYLVNCLRNSATGCLPRRSSQRDARK